MIALVKINNIADLSSVWAICVNWRVPSSNRIEELKGLYKKDPTNEVILGEGKVIYSNHPLIQKTWHVFNEPSKTEVFETIEQLFEKHPDLMIDCI